MKIQLRYGLPFITGTISFRGKTLLLTHMLLDSGSEGTVLSADKLTEIGVVLGYADQMRQIHGVGGSEFVFIRTVDALSVEDFGVTNFVIEVGAMDYGFEIDGIIGMNFLQKVGAIVDFDRMEIHAAKMV